MKVLVLDKSSYGVFSCSVLNYSSKEKKKNPLCSKDLSLNLFNVASIYCLYISHLYSSTMYTHLISHISVSRVVHGDTWTLFCWISHFDVFTWFAFDFGITSSLCFVLNTFLCLHTFVPPPPSFFVKFVLNKHVCTCMDACICVCVFMFMLCVGVVQKTKATPGADELPAFS